MTIKLRKLVQDVTATKKRIWSDRYFYGQQERIQQWDDKEGWTDIPTAYEYINVKEEY